jgi:site-specific DNA recombinase
MERPALQRLLADIGEGLVDVVVVLQGRSTHSFTGRLRQNGRDVRCARGVLCGGDPAVQHHHLDGQADAECVALFRPVRAGGYRRAHPRQNRSLQAQGHVDGRCSSAGYEARERRLVVNPTEANTVRYIYERYLELGCVRQLSRELDERRIVSKVRISKKGVKSGGCRFSRGALYELLANPIHIGEIRHKQERYRGSTKRLSRASFR